MRARELPVEGSDQYDAAVEPSVAAASSAIRPVAGRATVADLPDLNAGSSTYKAVAAFCGCDRDPAPVLRGLRKPVNDYLGVHWSTT